MSPEAQARAHHLDTYLSSRRDLTWLDRALVLDQCASTQDEAFAAAAGRAGLLVTSITQTKGRGRLGRPWSQRADLGLPVTFALDADRHETASLPLRMACAVCDACEKLSPMARPESDMFPHFRIKWPNDVVVALDPLKRHAPHRKLAGILIERRDRLLLVGVGINVLQSEIDWSESLRSRAVSLAMLGDPPRHDWLLRRLIESMDHFLFADRREIRQEFKVRDVLTGSRQTFDFGTKRLTGLVQSIDPIDGIVLVQDDGSSVTLPAMPATLVPADSQ
jgi:BirA family transcriptional regulator, biotin operon repressor / biotin---[acetyl-CoA-carboxylase] ligase